jgi:hypothetical protein
MPLNFRRSIPLSLAALAFTAIAPAAQAFENWYINFGNDDCTDYSITIAKGDNVEFAFYWND